MCPKKPEVIFSIPCSWQRSDVAGSDCSKWTDIQIVEIKFWCESYRQDNNCWRFVKWCERVFSLKSKLVGHVLRKPYCACTRRTQQSLTSALLPQEIAHASSLACASSTFWLGDKARGVANDIFYPWIKQTTTLKLFFYTCPSVSWKYLSLSANVPTSVTW